MKRFSIFAAICMFFGLQSISAQKIAVLNGPSSIPCAYIMEENQEYEFMNCASAQIELPKLIKGELDLGFLPPNLAAKVHTENKGALVCLGICGNGNIYLITKDENFSDMSQLQGKTVACAGQGATPEYVSKYILEKKGIKNVTLDFSTPNPQIVPSLLAGKFEYAIVPEPFASAAETKDSGIKRFSISSEFSKLNGGKDFPMTVLVANRKYASTHKKEIDAFLKIYENAVKRTVENPSVAAKLSEKHNLGLTAEIAEKAIPNCAFTWIPAKKSKAQIEILLKIFAQKIPDSKFYY
ncbi:MAG: ABC transporter substrate-binding protein [Treponema sp.]|nr:ABC transporter substrate-binding protein [Treponema sp.]MBQ5383958.1 ABC transporter substrate-binding protein [Treponema sp.]